MEESAKGWIDRFATELGVEPPEDETMERLLELAGIAAHSSERIAAPIACWMAGAASIEPQRALEIARRLEGERNG